MLVDALSEDLQVGLTPEQQTLFEDLNAPPPQPGAEFFDFNTVVAELRQSRHHIGRASAGGDG